MRRAVHGVTGRLTTSRRVENFLMLGYRRPAGSRSSSRLSMIFITSAMAALVHRLATASTAIIFGCWPFRSLRCRCATVRNVRMSRPRLENIRSPKRSFAERTSGNHFRRDCSSRCAMPRHQFKLVSSSQTADSILNLGQETLNDHRDAVCRGADRNVRHEARAFGNA